MSLARFVSSFIVAFTALTVIPLCAFADCPPGGCPQAPSPQEPLFQPPKQPPNKPVLPLPGPRNPNYHEGSPPDTQGDLPGLQPVTPETPPELILDPEARQFQDYLHSPEFQEDAAQSTLDDLGKQLAALRQYESELLKERAWNESRRAYAGVIISGNRVTGPSSAYMDKNGRPLPDQLVIGPDQIDAQNVHNDSTEAIHQIDLSLRDLRRQIAELEARLARHGNKRKSTSSPPKTYMSPVPSDQAVGGQPLDPDSF